MNREQLLVGIPKGTIQASVLETLAAGGLDLSFPGRKLHATAPSLPNVVFLRLKPPDIPRLIASGHLVCGFAGLDQVSELGLAHAELQIAADLGSSKSLLRPVRWTFAVEDSFEGASIRAFWNFQKARGVTELNVATEIPNLTREWLCARSIPFAMHSMSGSTEAAIPWFVDAIVDLVDSGESLRANNLKGLDVVFESTVCLWVRQDKNSDVAIALRHHVHRGVERLKADARRDTHDHSS